MTEQLFTAIAKEHLSIETLETRRSDSTMSICTVSHCRVKARSR